MIFYRLFKRLLDPKMEKRPVSVLEVNKYVEDRWLAKLGAEKALNGTHRYNKFRLDIQSAFRNI